MPATAPQLRRPASAVRPPGPPRVPPAAGREAVPFPGDLATAPGAASFGRDAPIVAQGARAGRCFQVAAGCVRTVRLLEDGRRHVGEFLLAGDVFGWETEGEHAFAAEAVTPVTLRRFARHAVEARAAADPAFALTLRQYVASQVRTARGRLVLLGRKTAAERVASFLIEMRDRLPDPHASVLELPMGRADMADYLGLTVETVCRELTGLRHHGVIAVERTRVVIQNPAALGRAGADQLH